MRILIFEQRYTPPTEPGIARFGMFSKYWAHEGHKVTIISGMVNYISGRKPEEYQGRLFVKEKESENVNVIRVFDSFPGYRTFLGRLLSYFVFIKFAFWAALFVRKPDIIVASSPPIFVGILGYVISAHRLFLR